MRRLLTLQVLLILLTSVSPIMLVHVTATSPSITQSYLPHSPILIIGDSAFTRLNGVLSGSGRTSDPYVIEGWQINSIEGGISIFNTTSSFVVQAVQILGGVRQGIYLYNVTSGTIRLSSIANNPVDILVDRSNQVSVSDNVISNNTGVMIARSNGIAIIGNTITDSTGGITVDRSTSVSITGNKVSSNIQRQSPGIFVHNSSSPLIANNDIWFSDHAIYLDRADHAVVTGNNASFNAISGITTVSSAASNITGNYVAHNGFGGIQAGGFITRNIVDHNRGTGISAGDNSTISGNQVTFNSDNGGSFYYPQYGIVAGDNATITNNTLAFNAWGGIACCFGNAVITKNVFSEDGLVLDNVNRKYPAYPSITITPDNLVNGKPLI